MKRLWTWLTGWFRRNPSPLDRFGLEIVGMEPPPLMILVRVTPLLTGEQRRAIIGNLEAWRARNGVTTPMLVLGDEIQGMTAISGRRSGEVH